MAEVQSTYLVRATDHRWNTLNSLMMREVLRPMINVGHRCHY